MRKCTGLPSTLSGAAPALQLAEQHARELDLARSP